MLAVAYDTPSCRPHGSVNPACILEQANAVGAGRFRTKPSCGIFAHGTDACCDFTSRSIKTGRVVDA